MVDDPIDTYRKARLEREVARWRHAGFSERDAQRIAATVVLEIDEFLRSLFDAAPVALVLTRARTETVLLANRRAAALFEFDGLTVLGQSAGDFHASQDDRLAIVERLQRDGSVEAYLAPMRTGTGRLFWANLSGQRVDYEGEPCYLVGIEDVTEQRMLEERLRERATFDDLTGVFNRRHFNELAALEIGRSNRTARPLCLIMLDVDHFKQVNDQHGHPAGDLVLQSLARACTNTLRSRDVFARVGGEEFAALLLDTSLAEGQAIAERMRQTIEAMGVSRRSDDPLAEALHVTISLGIVQRNAQEDLESLLSRADTALYAAKGAGRNRVIVG